MARAQFQKGQKVWVESVGAWEPEPRDPSELRKADR